MRAKLERNTEFTAEEGKNRQIVLAFCELKFPEDPEWILTEVDRTEIARAKSKSLTREGQIWNEFPDRMAEKTAVRLACRKEMYRIESEGILAYLRDEGIEPDDDPQGGGQPGDIETTVAHVEPEVQPAPPPPPPTEPDKTETGSTAPGAEADIFGEDWANGMRGTPPEQPNSQQANGGETQQRRGDF